MAVFYWVENQAGERVGVENHPGSDDSGRQCRPHKGVVGDMTERGCCGLGLDSIVGGRGKVQQDCLSLGRIYGLKRISYNLHCFMFMIIFNI